MSSRRNLAVVCLLAGAIGLVLGGGLPSALGEDETKTTAEPVVSPPYQIDASLIWNFHKHAKARRGDFIELTDVEDKEHRGYGLVITHFELRTRQSMQVQVVEHEKDKKKVRRDGKPIWNKKVRRGPAFSFGSFDSTTRWLSSGYSSVTGMRFKPGTRPSIEVTQGSGEFWVYAEGYWTRR